MKLKMNDKEVLVCIENTDLPHPSAEPCTGEPERTAPDNIRSQPVRQLQGRSGKAATHDLSKRIPHHQGLRYGDRHFLTRLPEQRSKEGLCYFGCQ